MSLPITTYILPSLDMFVLLVYDLSKIHGRNYVQDYLFLLHNFPAIYTRVQQTNNSRIPFPQITVSKFFTY